MGTITHAEACRRYRELHPERNRASNAVSHRKWREAQPPERKIWEGMKDRVSRPHAPGNACYEDVTICVRWLGSHGFKNFLADMGPRPSPDHSIDRYPNPAGNYEPTNCRWATDQEQRNNRREAA